jgi:hypothetical protein
MLQMTLHLTRSRRRTLLLLGLEVFLVYKKKKKHSTVFIEIHKGAIFDRLKVKYICKNGGGARIFKTKQQYLCYH